MSRLWVRDGLFSPEVSAWLQGHGHELVASQPGWPPPCDLVIIPAPHDCLDWIRSIRQQECHSQLARVPLLGLAATGDLRPLYQAGLDGCLGSLDWEPELESLLAHLSVWTGPAYDPAAALENMGSPAIVEQVLAVFVTSTPGLLAEVESACQSGQLDEIAKAAHRFAGGIGILGLIPSVRATLALESAARKGERVDQLRLVFLQALTRLQASLEDRLAVKLHTDSFPQS